MTGRTLLAPQGFNYTRINANGTFSIFTLTSQNPSGPLGLYGGVMINAPGTGWTLTVYDGSVGQNIVVAVVSPGASFAPPPPPFPLNLVNGLTVVAAGTAGDATIAWL